VNSPTLGASSRYAAKLGTAVEFDHTNYMEVPGLLGQPENVTIAAWANRDSSDGGASDLVSLGDSFVLRFTGSQVRAFIWNGTDWDTQVVYNSNYKGAGWHHFAAAFNNADNLLELYIDGALVDATTTTDSISWNLGSNTVIANHGNSDPSFYFKGSVDDVRVFGRPLCAADVFNLFRDFRPDGVRIKTWLETR